MTSSGDQTNRTLAGTSYTLAYDFESRLSSITQGSNTTSFTYDALDRRYSRTSGGTTTRFYCGPGGILAEKQGGTFTAAYAYGNTLIRRNAEYPMFDGIGSQRSVTNSSQTITATAIIEGFGQTVASTGTSSSPYTFAAKSGYRTDGDAGLIYAEARYYDPVAGRFTTRDTYLDQHPYLYCEHDPVNWVDPTGHDAFSDLIDEHVGGAIRYVGGQVVTIGKRIWNSITDPPKANPFIWVGSKSTSSPGDPRANNPNPPRTKPPKGPPGYGGPNQRLPPIVPPEVSGKQELILKWLMENFGFPGS